MTLHGSGRDGKILLDHWKGIASKEGIILAGPDAINREGWDRARKIPIGLWVGTDDRLFPLANVRQTRDGLSSLGFPVELKEIPRHTHDYYSRSSAINKEAWAFLQKHRLEADPKYQVYAFR